MIKHIKRWFAYKREERQLTQWANGFDFAAGSIIRGATPARMQALYNDPCSINHAFDQGMEDAVDKMVELGWVQDDRI